MTMAYFNLSFPCRYNYHCVIYGWDPKCECSKEWQDHMGIHRLEDKDKQPFYNVFVEDGSNRYAAEGMYTTEKG